MNRQYFGTDGVRGAYGGPVINATFARRLGAAVGRWMKRAATEKSPGAAPRVLIGRDTRESGPILEAALANGLAAEGMVAISLGVIPTPAVSRAVRAHGAALGVVITASHNPAGDNGIKFFGPAGGKLSDAEEHAIEQELLPDAGLNDGPNGDAPVQILPSAAAEYIEAASLLLPRACLQGWRIVLDTANGATCHTSPAVLRSLGAEVIGLGATPDGRNINAGVGSEHPGPLVTAVCGAAARLGIAHDGDGDRCILCDERGEILDGDEILTMLAVHALRRGTLAGNVLVVTVQSNLGVEAAVKAAGGRVLRTPVGDRYVSERMFTEGAKLGGESSGHLIFAEVSRTGDGLVAALKVIEVMLATGQPLSTLRRALRKYPQLTSALKVGEKRPLEQLPVLQATIHAIEAEFGECGRVLVRYSGTEPKIRLLVEGEDATRVKSCLSRLEAAVRADLPAG
jgi:phosphoglucosamine mutase